MEALFLVWQEVFTPSVHLPSLVTTMSVCGVARHLLLAVHPRLAPTHAHTLLEGSDKTWTGSGQDWNLVWIGLGTYGVS